MLRRAAAHDEVIDVREELAHLGPDAVEVHARTLAVGDYLAATLVVTGYPAEVVPGWLDPLLTYPGRLDVALHIEPVTRALAAQQLKKQRAHLESTRRTGLDRGRLDDPDTEAAAQDAAELAYRIARGEGKLFRLGLYMTVYGESEEHLADEVALVRSIAESLLVSTAPATYRALPGWLSTLPLGIDTLKVRRTFDTEALAACFPFASPRPARRCRDGSGRRPVRDQHRQRFTRAVGPLRAGQLQLGAPGPLRGRQVVPDQTRTAPAAVHRHRGHGHRPGGRVRPPRRSRRRHRHPPR
ncbi:hypothetical protein HEP87_59665 [Streptomyces sp. S1D4-11]